MIYPEMERKIQNTVEHFYHGNTVVTVPDRKNDLGLERTYKRQKATYVFHMDSLPMSL